MYALSVIESLFIHLKHILHYNILYVFIDGQPRGSIDSTLEYRQTDLDAALAASQEILINPAGLGMATGEETMSLGGRPIPTVIVEEDNGGSGSGSSSTRSSVRRTVSSPTRADERRTQSSFKALKPSAEGSSGMRKSPLSFSPRQGFWNSAGTCFELNAAARGERRGVVDALRVIDRGRGRQSEHFGHFDFSLEAFGNEQRPLSGDSVHQANSFDFSQISG